ncbi:ATP-dependent helicase [Patescibacteria group bacterium]|nr:ATP-dependent helicase [Patescibacteria group bacterium]MBU0964072.1 ATP-dependent helicase [Patescibacteria group bacterium]
MDIFSNLNPAQKKAVQFEEGPLLIVAGAGTGKTTVITQRLAWLIKDQKVGTDNILALTFTEKAASEMEERVDVLLPYGYVDLWISTFHSFCDRILKDNALEIGLPPDFKLLNTTDQALLIRQNFDAFELDYYRPLGNPTKFIQALVKHFSRAKDENILPDEYLEYAKSLKLDRDQEEFVKKKGEDDEEVSEDQRVMEVANAYHVYQQMLLDNSALDFGDLILYTIKLFKTRPKILKKYQEQFRYILVDEFQDTNYAQYELIKMLAKPKNNLTVVGDDDQSIYKFRGAAISNILEFKKDFPKSQEIVLTDNYRTKQNILDLAYKFIKQNDPNRLEYQLSKGKIDPKGAPLKTKISKELKSQVGQTGIINHLHYKSHFEEASGVTKQIIELKNSAKGGSASGGKKLLWSDFAILVRANAYAQEFINSLSRFDIPHQFLASKGLYSQTEILDVVSYFKMLDNYHENAAMWRVLNLPQWNLNAQSVQGLMALSVYARRKNISLYEASQKSRIITNLTPKFHLAIDKIITMIQKHTVIARHKSVMQVGLQFMKDSGYLKYITKDDRPENMEKVIHLNQFFKEIEQFEAVNEDKSVKNFLIKFEQAREAGEYGSLRQPMEEGPEAVKIMTIHGAKGLEFPYVFLISLVDKRFPTIERREPIELPDKLIKEIIPEGDIHLQEERRLFYVGMTRAREGLFFTSADDYGGTRAKKPSRFLIELGFERKKGTEELDTADRLRSPAKEQQEIKELKFLQQAIPDKASYTQVRAFTTCPKQFKYAHIYRVPVEGRFTFSFGKSIHNTLFHFFKLITERSSIQQEDLFGASKKVSKDKDKQKASWDELQKIYEEQWLDDWYISKEHMEEYFAKGKSALKEFYDSHQGEFPTPLHLEKMFNIKLGKYTFKGVIDRIDKVGTGQEAEIIDYKTGKWPKNGKLSPNDKEQLLIYTLAAKDILKVKPVLLSYYYIEANKKISFAPEEKDLDKIKTKLLKVIENIRASDFKASPGFWCNSCDFKDICEDRWRG